MKMNGHTIQIGCNPTDTTLECSCGRVIVRVKAEGSEARERAFKLGRTKAHDHIEKPWEPTETLVAA